VALFIEENGVTNQSTRNKNVSANLEIELNKKAHTTANQQISGEPK